MTRSTRIARTTPLTRLTRLAAALVLVGANGLAVLPVLLPVTAQAQTNSNAAIPRITAFDVQGVDRVEAGTDLAFTLWGTPGAQASLQIAGTARPFSLVEVSPGVYQGTYTVSRRDRIAPDAQVIGNLRQGNRVGTAALDEPLQQGYVVTPPPVAPVAGLPQIKRFEVTEGGNRRNGTVLYLVAEGSPGARVSARVPGAEAGRVLLHEDQPGVYRGEYRVQAEDRLTPQTPMVLRMRLGDHSTTSSLDRWSSNSSSSAGSVRPVAAALCADCATVQAINRIEVDGNGSVVGSVAGGLLGAVIGSQFGGGNGRTAAGVAGAVGGALLGREVEKNARKREQFEVVLRMRDGQRQTVTLGQAPNVKVGEQVRVVDGALQRVGT